MDAIKSLDDLYDALESLKTVRYVIVSVLAYASIDYCGSFTSEIRYMWRGSWSTVKVLFFLSRYLVFVDVPMNVWFNEAVDPSPQMCSRVVSAMIVMTVLTTGLCEVVMFNRAYALSQQKRAVAIYLASHWIVAQAASLTLAGLFARSVTFITLPPSLPLRLNGCLVDGGQTLYAAVIIVIALFSQLVATGLSFYFVTRNFRKSSGYIIHEIYKDGILYFFVMSAILIACVVACFALPIGWMLVATVAARVFYALLATRMILNMREAAHIVTRHGTESAQHIRSRRRSRGFRRSGSVHASGILVSVTHTIV